MRHAQRVPFDGMVQERTEQIQAWLKRFDVVIIGPGLGRDEMTMKTVINVSPLAGISYAQASACK